MPAAEGASACIGSTHLSNFAALPQALWRLAILNARVRDVLCCVHKQRALGQLLISFVGDVTLLTLPSESGCY